MDPDAALRICLSDAPEAERHEAALALQNWLKQGGFPPAARTVEEAGAGIRRRLDPAQGGKLSLTRHDGHWSIYYAGSAGSPVPPTVWRLRKGPDIRKGRDRKAS